jgi:hypothetical protein
MPIRFPRGLIRLRRGLIRLRRMLRRRFLLEPRLVQLGLYAQSLHPT